MKPRLLLALLLSSFLLFLLALSLPVMAAPNAAFTPFPTPTPGPDGRIVYIAQANDSAWRIAAIFGKTVDELRALNKWGDNPVIKAGDQVLLGLAGPAIVTQTLGPSPTPEPLLPTPSPKPGWGNLCVILYNDLNGDSMRQSDEPSIPKGAISVSDRSGSVSKTATTTGGTDPFCFNELPEGTYNVSVAVPKGYNPTTVMSRSIDLKAGDVTYLDFGAQADSVTVVTAPTPQGDGKSPLLAVAGSLLLVGGVGLGLFAGRLMKLTKAARN